MYRIQSGESFRTTFHRSVRFTFPTSLCATNTAGAHTTKIPICNIQKKASGATRRPVTAPRFTHRLRTRPTAEKQTKNQRKGLIQSGTGFALVSDPAAVAGARFCSKVAIPNSSSTELEALFGL